MKQRLNKLIAARGICSRRKADALIRDGRVLVNGIPVTLLGTQVDPEADTISVNGTLLSPQKKIYILLNKPAGYITTAADRHAGKTVFELLPPLAQRVFAVGRLDKDTEGLLLFTNDGDIAQQLLHPKFSVDRVYLVTMRGTLLPETAAAMEKGGLPIDDYITSACAITILRQDAAQTEVKLTIREGHKRQIRRMFAQSGHPVLTLRRVQFGPLHLGSLPLGQWQYIEKPVLR